MPRKKKRVLDNVESKIPNVPALQKSIAERLSTLPHGFYQLLAQNPMQVEKWRMEKRFYISVGQVIDAFFTGNAPPAFEGMPKHEQDAIELAVWEFLSFYSMIAANWKSVRKAIENKSCPAIPILPKCQGELTISGGEAKTATAQFSIPECAFSTLDTPGKVLTKAMEYSAIHQMDFYFGERQSQKETNYAKRKFAIDVQNSRRSNASPLLIQRIETELRKRLESDPCRHLEVICFLASHDSGKKGWARETVRAYMRAGYAREEFEKNELHPGRVKRQLFKSA